jgi:mono/diheme cytochrome c family protein
MSCPKAAEDVMMMLNRFGLRIAAVSALAFASGAAAAQTTAPKGDAVRGKTVFAAYGCYQCHGHQGQGSNAGPKLAPSPLPFDAVDRQLRKPRDRMPIYSYKTTSDQDIADMYAYLVSIPKAKAVADIPLLANAR